jgi:thymidine kinase
MLSAEAPGQIYKAGKIELILGPMFSGKTTELLRRINRHQIAHNRCLLIKNTLNDTSTIISTHDK